MIPADRPDVLPNPVGATHKDSLKESDRGFDSPKGLRDESDDAVVAARGSNSVWIENYKRGNLKFHFHVRVSGFGEYCVMLEGCDHRIVGDQHLSFTADGLKAQKRFRHGDQLVFVSRVQFLKQPKRMMIRIGSLVRLQIADQCLHFGMHSSHSIRVKLSGVGANRKLGLGIGRIASGQSPSNIVEGAAGVVDRIAEDQSPVVLRHGFKHLKPRQILRLVRIMFDDDGIRIVSVESPKFRVERVQMFTAVS
jgi:hypothetical protein